MFDSPLKIIEAIEKAIRICTEPRRQRGVVVLLKALELSNGMKLKKSTCSIVCKCFYFTLGYITIYFPKRISVNS